MEQLASEFIRRRRSIAVGRGQRYPESLRRLAVRFAGEAIAAGWSWSRTARHLGVASTTLERWCETHRADEQVGPMREVIIEEDALASPTGSVLVTPEGYRIEGLGAEELVELLRALRR